MTDQPRVWSVVGLDRALAPVRRVLAWVQEDPDARVGSAKFAHLNSARWIAEAKRLDVPEAIRERIDLLGERVAALDAECFSERRSRFAAAWQELVTLDQLLGLPARRMPQKVVPKPAWREMLVPDEPGGGSKQRSGSWSSAGWSGRMDTPLVEAGVAAYIADALFAHDICTPGDLLRLRPTGSISLEPVRHAGAKLEGELVAVSGRAGLATTVLEGDGARRHQLRLNGKGSVLVEFRSGAERDTVAPGSRLIVVGRPHAEEGRPVILRQAELLAPKAAPVLVQYGLGDSDHLVRAALRALAPNWRLIGDALNGLAPARLPALSSALSTIHGQTSGTFEPARERLAFDETLLAQLGLSWERFRGARERGLRHAVLHSSASRLGTWGQAALDDRQQEAFEDIKRDLRRPQPMLRVLSGDVGSGKGRVALMAAAMVAESRHQVMLLCPDQASAEQRYLFAEQTLRDAGVVAQLVDTPSSAVADAIKRGEIQVVVGTLELLEARLDFRRLGLVIATERDNWGYASQLIRQLRTPRPDALIVTSTPVGVPIALTAYPDHDLTVVSSPPIRAQVDVYGDEERRAAYAAAAARVAAGEQALVVFPMARGTDALDPSETVRVMRALSSDAFPGARVGIFHGSASREERLGTWWDFVHRRIDVLVATTHVEDAPPVPGASTVIVEQAERMSRGRLKRVCAFVRGQGAAHAHLVLGAQASSQAADELTALFKESSGTGVADSEIDLSGVTTLTVDDAFPTGDWRWLDAKSDRRILLEARDAAHRVLREDPGLRRPANQRIVALARECWSKVWPDGPACPLPEASPSAKRRRRRRRRR